uniref:Cytochrome b n=1 Tax=Rhizophagus irregularis TaxID=588596 RepID=A0A140GAX8_9GLOM|nr:apocytochrome b [Rhizophagus irregularis]
MKLVKRHPLIALVNNYLIDSPAPSNLSYIWNFGSLLGTCLALQIITGVTLAMHYIGSVDLAFSSVEHIMRDVNSGWLIRYLHSNGAAFFFIFVYIHMAKALYYGSFRAPRILLWSIGVVIFLVMIITAFLGYVLPWGQMSYWGATVITNLLSAIPWIGTDLVEFIWGGFSVSNATLTRFFSLHFLLPFVLAALAFMHLIALHQNASNNPMGVSSKMDRVPFYPYYVFKDIVGFFVFFLILSIFVFFFPNALGHPDNSIPANPMQTPISIVPEFYLLPFYAILRAIPNKLLGVVAMLAAIFILFLLPYLESSRVRSSAFRPFMRIFFWLFAVNFLLLMWIGANHPEPPFILLGQLCTAFYFAYFLILVPLIGLIENTLSDLGTINPSKNTPQGLFSVENRGNYIPRITFRAFQQRLFLIMGIYRRKVNS